jgi:hypothetical protein
MTGGIKNPRRNERSGEGGGEEVVKKSLQAYLDLA